MQYRANNLQLLAVDTLSGFIGEEQQKITAIGEEVGEFVDMDLGLWRKFLQVRILVSTRALLHEASLDRNGQSVI